MTTNQCVDCGKFIKKASTQCRDCYNKARSERKAINKNYCPDCDKEILRSSRRCWDCSVKAKKGRDRSVEQPVAERQICPKCRGYKHHLAQVCRECRSQSDPDNKCENCGEPAHRYAILCWECWRTRGRNYNTCIDCGKVVQRTSTRCSACYGKYRSEVFVGENNPLWNPNISEEERARWRKEHRYVEWRKAVRKRDGCQCQICGKRSRCMNVHHLEAYNTAKELRFDVNNGICLCKQCHIDFHKQFGYGGNTQEQFVQFAKECGTFLLSVV